MLHRKSVASDDSKLWMMFCRNFDHGMVQSCGPRGDVKVDQTLQIHEIAHGQEEKEPGVGNALVLVYDPSEVVRHFLSLGAQPFNCRLGRLSERVIVVTQGVAHDNDLMNHVLN